MLESTACQDANGQKALVTCEHLGQVLKEKSFSDYGNMCIREHIHKMVNLENEKNLCHSQKLSPHCCYGKVAYKIDIMNCQSLDFQ